MARGTGRFVQHHVDREPACIGFGPHDRVDALKFAVAAVGIGKPEPQKRRRLNDDVLEQGRGRHGDPHEMRCDPRDFEDGGLVVAPTEAPQQGALQTSTHILNPLVGRISVSLT